MWVNTSCAGFTFHTILCVFWEQAGKLSQEEAVAIAEKLGLVNAPAIERTTSLSKATQLYNFSVLKWSKGGSVQRLILQVHIVKTIAKFQGWCVVVLYVQSWDISWCLMMLCRYQYSKLLGGAFVPGTLYLIATWCWLTLVIQLGAGAFSYSV